MAGDLIFVCGGNIDVPEIGRVMVTVRRNARSMRLRWKGPVLSLTVPYGQSYSQAIAFVQGSRGFIDSHRPKPLYAIDQVIQAPEISIEIKSSPAMSKRVRTIFGSSNSCSILVASDLDINSPEVTKTIDSMLRRIAFHFAPDILLPQARAISEKLNVHPSYWKVSRGQRTLGLCSSARRICLSCLLIFYPPSLREYVICHELAHLDHMDHSPAFHALCDSYYGGGSAAARAALRQTKLPLIR
ncbi:MAG: M48 family metallopeptidase [Clostridium sp.]|nr:M48 family metallopeptidase [Clostridium sp.]